MAISTKRQTIFDYFLYISCIFPIVTTLIDGTSLNKIIFFVFVLLFLFLILRVGFSKRTLFFFAFLLINYIFVFSVTISDKLGSINMFFYYPFMIGYSCLFIDHKKFFLECFKKNEKYVLFIIRLWSLIVGISIFIPGCYYIKEGDSYYFGSFCGSIFRLGPAALFIMSLTLISMSVYRRKKDFFYVIIPMYCMFMGSSRTYLISGLCLFLIAWYWFIGGGKEFWLTFIPLLIALFFLIWNSSMGDKIRFTLDDEQYGDFWFRVSSGRSEFWLVDLNGWSSSIWINKIFGCGLFFTQNLSGHWGHNDFIELICSFGLLGLIEYCIIQIMLIKKFLNKKSRISIIIRVVAILCWLFNAFFNMYYTYFCALLSYPYILMSISYYYNNQNEPTALYV